MKVFIPGKSTERRIPNKNYRPFYYDKSLIDILVEKLIPLLPRDSIYLSCEKEEYRTIANKWGINFLLRDDSLTTPASVSIELITSVSQLIPEDDILWATCVEPFFDEYGKLLETWNSLDKNKFDSLNVVYPVKRQFLDDNHNPIGFGFGLWYKNPQSTQPLYNISWATAITSAKCIREAGFLVGKNPYWYDSYAKVFDIDTIEDFEFASLAYTALKDSENK